MASVLGLDIGERRVGVAIAALDTRFPRPLVTLTNDDQLTAALQALCQEHQVQSLVAGLPRSLDGQETAQTTYARELGEELAKQLNLPLYFTDEAVTSRQAEAELQSRGKPYSKGDIDALAATYILEDYVATLGTKGNEA